MFGRMCTEDLHSFAFPIHETTGGAPTQIYHTTSRIMTLLHATCYGSYPRSMLSHASPLSFTAILVGFAASSSASIRPSR
jgi:hypothetical protein